MRQKRMMGKRISFVNGTNGTNGKAELSHLYVLMGGRIRADSAHDPSY